MGDWQVKLFPLFLFFILILSVLAGAKTYNMVQMPNCINASVNVTISDLENRYRILGCTYNKTSWNCNSTCDKLEVYLTKESEQILKFKIGYYYKDSNKTFYRYFTPIVKITTTTEETTTTTTTTTTTEETTTTIKAENNTIISIINKTLTSNVSNIIKFKPQWYNNTLVQLIALVVILIISCYLIWKAIEKRDGLL